MKIKAERSHHFNAKGQITVPKALRNMMGWTTTTTLVLIQEHDGIRVISDKQQEGVSSLALNKKAKGINKSA